MIAARDDNPTTHTFRALVRLYGLVGRIMQPYFAGYGISGAQWGVLRTLQRWEAERKGPLRLSDLSDRLVVRPPSVTGVVNRLKLMNLVRCAASPVDRRVKHIRLAPAGRRLLERVLRRHDVQTALVLAGLDSPEQAQLKRLLDKVSSHLERVVQQHGNGSIRTVTRRGET